MIGRPFLHCSLLRAASALLLVTIFLTGALAAQKTDLTYKVFQNNNEIGWIKLQKMDTGSHCHIQLQSEIRKRMVFWVSVVEKQQALFNDGLMIESYIYRKVNDDIRINKRTQFAGGHYEVKSDNLSERLSIGNIRYNQLSLYFREPVNITQVYSDNFQRYLTIRRKGNSSYTISFPDGNRNHYYYTNGVCSRITIEHSMFTVDLIKV